MPTAACDPTSLQNRRRVCQKNVPEGSRHHCSLELQMESDPVREGSDRETTGPAPAGPPRSWHPAPEPLVPMRRVRGLLRGVWLPGTPNRS